MTLVVLVSRADPASVTIRDALLSEASWREAGSFDGAPLRRRGGLAIAEIEGIHLDADGVGERLAEAVGDVEAVLVASKHKAASGSPSLTVHPVGNWGPEPAFGGRPRAFAPAPARRMAQALRLLKAEVEGAGLRHAVTFEVTHHGPWTSVPLAFVEVGSTEAEWTSHAPARAVARVLLAMGESPPPADPVILGVGGGHYAPKFVDLVLSRKAAVGHMLPGYAVDAGVDAETIRAAVAATPGASGYAVDSRGAKKGYAGVLAALSEAGLPPII
jgi:D-aminoacyl-tRNA deacylase